MFEKRPEQIAEPKVSALFNVVNDTVRIAKIGAHGTQSAIRTVGRLIMFIWLGVAIVGIFIGMLISR
jgi:hypothetical protein